MENEDLKRFFLDVIDEQFAIQAYPLAKKWHDGTIIFKPREEGAAEKDIPIATFLSKITKLRENLRVLEQKLNNHEGLSEADKAAMQGYITKCYGTMTSFNVFFRDDKDKFVGSSLKKKDAATGSSQQVDPATGKKLTIQQAKQKLGLKEY